MVFELEKSSPFFREMATDYPDVVHNIEIVHENKLSLDTSYHQPKFFMLNLNNMVRAVAALTASSLRNSPSWLFDCAKSYRDDNRDDYEIVNRLRNVSLHESLIFPGESLVTGLFRVRSSGEYVEKLGIGDRSKPTQYSEDLALQNTEEIFHDLLVFQSLAFMDLGHSALRECLGVTRRWYFHVKFSSRTKSYDEVLDVYQLVCRYSMQLLDEICHAYARHKGLIFEDSFVTPMAPCNSINTLLELDLYPSLFCDWWETNVTALNQGVRKARHDGDRYKGLDELHKESFTSLCDTPEDYIGLLQKYKDLSMEEYFDDENIAEFISFAFFNHWHFKKAFNYNLSDNIAVGPVDIQELQRQAKWFLTAYQMDKEDTECIVRLDQLRRHLNQLQTKLTDQ